MTDWDWFSLSCMKLENVEDWNSAMVRYEDTGGDKDSVGLHQVMME
jgi:hypothetical protein